MISQILVVVVASQAVIKAAFLAPRPAPVLLSRSPTFTFLIPLDFCCCDLRRHEVTSEEETPGGGALLWKEAVLKSGDGGSGQDRGHGARE